MQCDIVAFNDLSLEWDNLTANDIKPNIRSMSWLLQTITEYRATRTGGTWIIHTRLFSNREFNVELCCKACKTRNAWIMYAPTFHTSKSTPYCHFRFYWFYYIKSEVLVIQLLAYQQIMTSSLGNTVQKCYDQFDDSQKPMESVNIRDKSILIITLLAHPYWDLVPTL